MESLDLETQKKLIDYEIEAKRKAKEKEFNEWVKAIFFGLLFFIVLYIISSI
jgi:hypothetical protein